MKRYWKVLIAALAAPILAVAIVAAMPPPTCVPCQCCNCAWYACVFDCCWGPCSDVQKRAAADIKWAPSFARPLAMKAIMLDWRLHYGVVGMLGFGGKQK
jgi:hypothetical protein